MYMYMYIYIHISYIICVICVISKRRSSLGETLIKIKLVKFGKMVKFVKT